MFYIHFKLIASVFMLSICDAVIAMKRTCMFYMDFTLIVFVFMLSICDTKTINQSIIRQNKKRSMFRVTGLKILGRVGTLIFYLFFKF